MQYFQSWALPPGPHQGSALGPAGGFKASPDPQLNKAMISGHCFHAFGMISYTSTFYMHPAVPPTFTAVPNISYYP